MKIKGFSTLILLIFSLNLRAESDVKFGSYWMKPDNIANNQVLNAIEPEIKKYGYANCNIIMDDNEVNRAHEKLLSKLGYEVTYSTSISSENSSLSLEISFEGSRDKFLTKITRSGLEIFDENGEAVFKNFKYYVDTDEEIRFTNVRYYIFPNKEKDWINHKIDTSISHLVNSLPAAKNFPLCEK